MPTVSHARVKNIAADDDYDDYEDDYDNEDPGEPDPEMIEATAKARTILGPGFTEKEIQDSLWHYYYDVEKTVNYLLNQKTGAAKKQASKKTNEPIMSHTQCSYPETRVKSAIPHDFFADCPWLNVPKSRQAILNFESVLPRGGLLGGSSHGAPKMSKLAALAAARKKKEGEKSEDSKSTSSSIALLDRLGSKTKGARENDVSSASSESREQAQPLRKYPPRKKQSESPKATPKLPQQHEKIEASVPEEEQLPVPILSAPSAFGRTMLGVTSGSRDNPSNTRMHFTPSYVGVAFTEFNPFAGPSPDDVVANAQKSAKGMNNSKTTPKKTPGKDKGVNSVTTGIEKVTVSESKPRSKNLDVVAEYNKSKRKNALNFVVIGHVDAGKSTLMGRLLYDLGIVDKRTMERYRKEAENMGKGSFALAWVLDEGTAEREHGVTIDIATNKFETESTAFTILDAPGHRDFVPNMIAGAAQADFAVLVVDASTGNFESGLKGQTKEHALLVRSIGVQRLIVAVNKLDTVDWSKERYDEITQQTSAFLTAAGFSPSRVSFLPCSGLEGDNITRRSTVPSSNWYTGPILLELLDSSEPSTQNRSLSGPLRLPITEVFSRSVQFPLSVAGRISSGSVQVGERVIVVPGNETAYVKGVEVNDEPADWAVAGQNAILHLSDIEASHLKGGDLVCSHDSPVVARKEFSLKILAFDHVMPMFVSVVVGRLDVPGKIKSMGALLDKATGKVLSKKKPRIIKPGEVARVSIEVDVEGGIPLEEGARVVLRAAGETVATGLVEKSS